MSTDLRLERFGLELFNRLFWTCEGLPLPVAEYYHVKAEMNHIIFEVVVMYSGFFHKLHKDTYVAACDRPVENVMDLFQTASKHFPHRHLRNDLCAEVMMKFLLSCAYFHNVIVLNHAPTVAAKGVNFFQKAHLMWAMFADLELKDAFYAEGGWLELNRFAFVMRSVQPIALSIISREGLWQLDLEAITRMLLILKEGPSTETPICLQWVDSVVRTPRGPSCAMDSYTVREMEYLILFIRFLVDPADHVDMYFSLFMSVAKEQEVDLDVAVWALMNLRLGEVPKLWEAFKGYFKKSHEPEKNKETERKQEESVRVVESSSSSEI